jgi:N-acetylglucosaminyldiphosphoundecaprenol N-acetyl-beta-D-mannosaminyltransferase
MLTPSFPIGDGQRLHVNVASRDALLAAISARLRAGEGFTVATLNLDHLVKLNRSAAFRRAYLATTHVVADGNPIVWLSRLAGRPIDLAPGSELVEPICALAAAREAPVAFFGSTDATLETAAARLEAAHPGLCVALRAAPSRGFDPDGAEAGVAIERLRASGARLCFVALGAPKQERFAVRAAAALPGCGFISVGAGLDFIAGAQRRAPRWVRRLALEWLWRALSDPGRLLGRYVACAMIVPGLVLDSLRHRGALACEGS